MKVKSLSHVRLFGTLWTVVHRAPLPMGFSRQEYYSGLPFPSPGDLPHPGIELTSPSLAGGFFTTEPPGKPLRPFKGQQRNKFGVGRVGDMPRGETGLFREGLPMSLICKYMARACEEFIQPWEPF